MWKFSRAALSTCILYGLLVSGLAGIARAQFGSSIEGTVTDSSGAAVPQAQVKIKRVDTGVEQTATTNESGNFTFPTLPAGTYTVTASAAGFQTVVQENVVLQPSTVRSVPIQMAVGEVKTTVEVSADIIAVQTDESKITSVVSREELDSLPLPGRNVLNVVALTPGVTGTGMMGTNPAGVLVSNQSPAISANGATQFRQHVLH